PMLRSRNGTSPQASSRPPCMPPMTVETVAFPRDGANGKENEMGKRLAAEFLGTFWLIFGGCGSAVLAAQFFDPQNRNVNYGIGLIGVALAFGLTVLTMAYAI